MALADSMVQTVIAAAKGAKSFKGAKAYTSKQGKEGLILAELGGFAPEVIGEQVKDGKTYILSLKFSVTAREKTDDAPAVGGHGVL